ncbi:LytTR family DNA-binding domain-containing protein [Limibacter armeniacum]|uniref:LytR/AlgR family response regulator transcription factor n=1 Tax=Limibacter armeniacum TaxID=466084 RepID=UPI002FE54E52
MTKYLIIDDEPVAHDIIKGYCDMLPNLQLGGQCYDAIEALEFLNKQRVDLIFLDLNLPKLKGFELLRTLPAPPKIIVTTAYREYALEGYELNIVDYLLKPFGFERFLKAVNKATETHNTTPIAHTQVKDETQSIWLKTNKKYIQVNLSAILYVEAAGNYTKVVMEDEIVTIREKISELLRSFNYPDLIQIHKSFAVAKKQIKSIEGNRILVDKIEIPIGKTYKSQVMHLIG